jgi:hypothetical protein
MENQTKEKPLLTEMIEGLAQDLTELKRMVASQPQPTPLPDLPPFLQRVADAITGLREQVKNLSEQKSQPQAQAPDSSELIQELRAMRQDIRKSPANRITKAVQYGAGFLVLSLLTTGVLAYYATKWKAERDELVDSDWKWRVVRQDAPVYASELDQAFAHDSAYYYEKRVVELEAADAARAAAQKAAEQAKVMNAQADKLEGKSRPKTGKK